MGYKEWIRKKPPEKPINRAIRINSDAEVDSFEFIDKFPEVMEGLKDADFAFIQWALAYHISLRSIESEPDKKAVEELIHRVSNFNFDALVSVDPDLHDKDESLTQAYGLAAFSYGKALYIAKRDKKRIEDLPAFKVVTAPHINMMNQLRAGTIKG